MALVLIDNAQEADALPVRPTVDLHQLVVLRAHLFLQRDADGDQLVLLQHGDAAVRLQVSRAVGRHARQARHGGFVGSGAAAEITGHILWAGAGQRSRGLPGAAQLQLLHHLLEVVD